MTPESLALIAAYLMCSETAETRVLDRSEVETCTSLYMEVKLGFVPDVDVEEYDTMTTTERAEINQQGYAGYVAWRVANPELVEQMEADAVGQLAMVDHCVNRPSSDKSPDPAVSPDGWGQAVGDIGDTNADVDPGDATYGGCDGR
ncbi:hypothetical protein [Halocynthiibacter namhaensis]|uniref:hypothetical protein n=1 Tax=Halocynthiibacter namhaensis TaxID=1290553 RepID=UPI00057909A7|nr:hypothetical protein [Halocynthiibacter namhaensis]